MKKYKKNKKITRQYLQGATYRYLERYATTEANLINILKRKVARIIADQDGETENSDQVNDWIKDIVENCVKHNLVNDQLYAQSRLRSFLNTGNSISVINAKLRAKGVPADIIDQVLQEQLSQTHNLNFISAIKYAKRRRFGPFRLKEHQEDTTRKEQASMARAGFSYDETMKVLRASRDELEDILYET